MTRKNWLGIILVLLFVCLKFYPFLLSQKVPIPMDIFAGGYWPWRLVDYGYPAGVPIKNPIVSDVVSQLYVWNDLFWSLSKQRLFPLWDRFALLGYPYYANYHSAVFYPLNLIGLITDSMTARTLVMLLTQMIAVTGVYGLVRYRKNSKPAAVVAAIFFVSAGLMTSDFLFSSGSRAISFLPYIFWFTDLYFSKRNGRYLKLLAISWLMLLLSGHFQITVLSTVIWFWYVLSVRGAYNLKAKLFVYWLLGVLASFVQLIPTIELLSLSFRTGESYISQVNYGLLPVKHLVTLLFAPDAFGNNATGNYFGFWNYRESIGYLGLIPGFLIFLGLLRKPRQFFSIVFGLSLIMVFVHPLGRIVYLTDMPLISGSAASRWLFITVFAGSVLVAEGFDLFFKRISVKALMLYSSFFLMTAIWFGVEKIAYMTAETSLAHEVFFKNNMISIRNMAIPTANMFLLLILAVALYVGKKRVKDLIVCALILLICVDFLRYHFKFNGFVARNIAPQEYQIHEELATGRRLSATSDELFPPNSSTLLRFPSVIGYDPLYPLENGIFLNAINGDNDVGHVGRYFNKISNTKSKLLDYASVGYLATLTRGKDGLLSDKGEVPYFIDKEKWSQIYREKEMLVLENKSALPLFYTPSTLVVAKRDKHIELMNQSVDTRAFVEEELPTEWDAGTASYKVYENGEAEVSVHGDSDTYLVYNQAIYPGWEAAIDGKPTKIYKTNYIFGGVIVPKGEHLVTWKFAPKSFYFGAFVSILSLLVISLYRDEQET